MWLRNYRYKRELKKLTRTLQNKLVGVQRAQCYLPVCYPSWRKFWSDTRGNHTYIVMPEIREEHGLWYFTEEPHVWHKEYIRQKAIQEAMEQEDYEMAAKIKDE